MRKAKIEIGDRFVLKKYIELLKNITDEAVFKVSEEGIKVSLLDKMDIIIVEWTYKNIEFDSEEEEIEFGVSNLSRLLKLLDSVSFLIDSIEVHNGWLLFNILGRGHNRIRYDLSDVDRKNPHDTNDLEFTGSFKVNPARLKRNINIFEGIMDDIWFTCGGDGVMCNFTDDENTKCSIEIKTVSETGHFCSKFASSHLAKIMDAVGDMTSLIEVKLRDDYPMQIEGSDKDGEFKVVLAPRVKYENEDDKNE